MARFGRTGGVFYAPLGATTATAIDANTTKPNTGSSNTTNPLTGTETRAVEVVNTGSGNTLEVSRDFSPKGTPNDATDIRSLSGPSGLPTSSTGLVASRIIPGNTNSSGGNTGSIDLSAATDNGVNSTRDPNSANFAHGNTFVYLSPEEFFYANAYTLYIADSGSPKNGSNGAGLGDGGLQKWVNSEPDGSGTWTLEYDMADGLGLVSQQTANSGTPTANGVTGLFGLTGEVMGDGTVDLFATSYGLNELSQSYLYEVTDNIANESYTVGQNEAFTTIYTAPSGELIRGVDFAPVPEPASMAILGSGLAVLGMARRGRK